MCVFNCAYIYIYICVCVCEHARVSVRYFCLLIMYVQCTLFGFLCFFLRMCDCVCVCVYVLIHILFDLAARLTEACNRLTTLQWALAASLEVELSLRALGPTVRRTRSSHAKSLANHFERFLKSQSKCKLSSAATSN